MSATTKAYEGVRILDMPDLGAVSDTSSVVGERAGSGRFSALEIRKYATAGLDNTPHLATIAALRALTSGAPIVYVAGFNAAGDGGGGFYTLGPPGADNGGTIIVSGNGTYYLQTHGAPVSIRQFGAKGDGATNDSPAIQAAVDAVKVTGRTLYIPAASVYYRLATPINLTNTSQLTIYGDGKYECLERTTPTGASVLAGATGTGGCMIDATGAAGLTLRDFTCASIGIPGASTVGLLTGNSTTVTGQAGNRFAIAILLPDSGASCGVYGVNTNLNDFSNMSVMADRCIYITNANDLGITPPFGTRGPNIQSDGNQGRNVTLLGYGASAAIPFVLVNCACHDWTMYIVNINGGPSYTGESYAMELNGCTDIRIKVEIDYFVCAVHQLGDWLNIDLSGVIYQWTTPVPGGGGQPTFAGLNGTSIKNCSFGIVGTSSLMSNISYGYGTVSSSPTLNLIHNTDFIFDIDIQPHWFYFDMTSANDEPLFNVRLNGSSDLPGMVLQVNGSPMPDDHIRIWMNGIRQGTG